MAEIMEAKEKVELKLAPDFIKYTKKKARALGVLYNAFLTMIADMGLRYFEGEVSIFCNQGEESHRRD